MNEIDSLAAQLDKTAATLVFSEDGDRHFIAESVLTAVALYLLKKYADGYLKGLGFEDLAKRHGEKTKAFLRHLRAGAIPGEADAAKADLDASLDIMRSRPANAQARSVALREVSLVFLEAGAVQSQAEGEAAKVVVEIDRMLVR